MESIYQYTKEQYPWFEKLSLRQKNSYTKSINDTALTYYKKEFLQHMSFFERFLTISNDNGSGYSLNSGMAGFGVGLICSMGTAVIFNYSTGENNNFNPAVIFGYGSIPAPIFAIAGFLYQRNYKARCKQIKI